MEFLKNYKKLIDIAMLFIVVFVITFTIKYYFQPFISMIIIFFISHPLYKACCRVGIGDKISGAISILIINVIIIIALFYLGSSIYSFGVGLYEKNVELIHQGITLLSNALSENFKEFNISGELMKLLQKDFVRTGAISTGEFFLAYFIGNISAFFLLVDREKFITLGELLLPQGIIKSLKKQRKNIKQMLTIQLILILISTLEIMIGFLILRIPNGFLLGIICGILDLLPYVGTIIVFIPIIIYNILVKNYLIAFAVVILFIIVQVVREVLEAKFLSNRLELHPLLVLLSIYIGVKLFGILGVFVGPVFGMFAKEIIYNEG
ncbi:MAG: AI-2E family transporter [Clostridium sp.]